MRQPKGKVNRKIIRDLFGVDDYGYSLIPIKSKSAWLYKWIAARERTDVCCPICFMVRVQDFRHPDRRCWKRYRRTQYKNKG